jgi:chemotaxis signal transduction protein
MTNPNARMLVQIHVDGDSYAIDAALIQEILGKRPWVPIPLSNRATPGVIEWRGRAIALLDVPALGEGRQLTAGELRARTIIVQTGSRTLALPIDRVQEIMEVGEHTIRASHATQHPYASLEVEIDGKPVPILDLPAVIEGLVGGAAKR